MKVLAGIDGTERSYHALEFGSRLLSPKVDDITLYFSPPKLKLSTPSEIAPELPEMARDALAESVFTKAKGRLPEEFHALVDSITGHNKPSDGILAAADETNADLIVIGAHGANRRLPLFVGGSSRKIAHRSQRPVLLVREEQQNSSAGLKVLIACQDCDLLGETAKILRDFSWPDGTEAMLFHVVPTMDEEHIEQLAAHAHPSVPNSDGLIEDYRSTIALQTAAKMDELARGREGLPSIVKNATPRVAQGHVVESIVKEVTSDNIDLVVVDARRLGRLGRLLGSTTEGLLAHCPCSLLVIHQHDTP